MLQFAKGHGTLNDFVCVTDPDGRLDLGPSDVAFLCDRRAGIGGDGILRAVRGAHVPEWKGDPDAWFIDDRNADGSIAEMCGNGLRVFLRYLAEEGLIEPDSDVRVGTRAGERGGRLLPDGRVRVWMGQPRLEAGAYGVRIGERTWPAMYADLGNPHLVVLLDEASELAGLDLRDQPGWTPEGDFPTGVNIEFAVPGDVTAMRVWERGVGETFSCGTGTVAVAAAVAARAGMTAGSFIIEPPGGSLTVDLRDGEAWLTGPAVIVARGTIDLEAHP